MSYCGPTWVSDYGWDLVYPRIQLIAGWDLGAPDPGEPELGTVLVGLLDGDGSETWFSTPGRVTQGELTPGHALQLATPHGLRELPAALSRPGEGDGITIAVELPAQIGDLSKVLDATWVSDELVHDIDLDALRRAE
jgi:hypothetical protein